jgi:GTPase SAR1 family protein
MAANNPKAKQFEGVQTDDWQVSDSTFAKFKRTFQKKKTIQTVLFGIAHGGKTTFVEAALGEKNLDNVEPTKTFEESMLSWKKHDILLKDLSGREQVRDLWKHYIAGCNVFVWFLDSTSTEEEEAESKSALWSFVKENALQKFPFLILVSKSDHADSRLKASEIVESWDFKELGIQIARVMDLSSKQNKNVVESIDWMVKVSGAMKYEAGTDGLSV